MTKSLRNLIAFILFMFLFFTVFTVVIAQWADSGLIFSAWMEMLDVIPFGKPVAQLALKFYSTVVSIAVDETYYLAGLKTLTVLDWLEDFCKMCLTAVVYEALSKAGIAWMEISQEKNIWMIIQKILWEIACAFISAITAGLLLKFLFEQMKQLSGAATAVISSVVIAIIVAGGVWIFHLLLKIGFGLAIGYVFVKMILMNCCKLLVTYMLSAFVLLCLMEGTYVRMFQGIGSWAVVIIIIIGIDLVLDSVFQ